MTSKNVIKIHFSHLNPLAPWNTFLCMAWNGRKSLTNGNWAQRYRPTEDTWTLQEQDTEDILRQGHQDMRRPAHQHRTHHGQRNTIALRMCLKRVWHLFWIIYCAGQIPQVLHLRLTSYASL